jgi:surface polysaccharide O-acyltransferase-like enzyme
MSQRDHALDSLRAVAMFMGIALHAFLAYTVTRVPFWPAADSDTTKLGDIFVFSVHEFRMQVFFVLAGFFGALIYQKYGLTGMLWHRFKRIGIPLILALITIQPLMQLLWLHGEPEALKYLGIPKRDLNLPTRDVIAQYLLSGEFLHYIRPAHLWFLYYLLFCFVMTVPLLVFEPMKAKFDSLIIRLPALKGRTIWLSLLLFPSVWFSYRWSIDTPERWIPQPHILLYYFLFFGIGWAFYRHRETLTQFTRDWKTQLLVANLVVLPAQMFFLIEAMPLMKEGDAYPEGMIHYKLFAVLLVNLYTWLMVAGLIGLFLTRFVVLVLSGASAAGDLAATDLPPSRTGWRGEVSSDHGNQHGLAALVV